MQLVIDIYRKVVLKIKFAKIKCLKINIRKNRESRFYRINELLNNQNLSLQGLHYIFGSIFNKFRSTFKCISFIIIHLKGYYTFNTVNS